MNLLDVVSGARARLSSVGRRHALLAAALVAQVTQLHADDLPYPWTTTAIGSTGSAALQFTGLAEETGETEVSRYRFASVGPGGTNTDFLFLHQQLRGSGSVTARIADPGAGRAGIMFRQALSANSNHFTTFITKSWTNKAVVNFTRYGSGSTLPDSVTTTLDFPVFLRVRRVASPVSGQVDSFAVDCSADGRHWLNAASGITHSSWGPTTPPLYAGATAWSSAGSTAANYDLSRIIVRKADPNFTGVLGGNTGGFALIFSDVVKSSTFFKYPLEDKPPENPDLRWYDNVPAIGSDQWPTAGFGLFFLRTLTLPEVADYNGLYHLVWEDRAGGPSTANVPVLFYNRGGSPGTAITQGTRFSTTISEGGVTRNVHVQPFTINRSGTSDANAMLAFQTDGANASLAGKIINVRIVRPGLPWDAIDPLKPEKGPMFYPPTLELMARGESFRTLNFSYENNDYSRNWADRPLVSDVFLKRQLTRTFADGSVQKSPTQYPLEYSVQICNQTDRDLWLVLPVDATDDMIKKIAELVRYGSDGVNPYNPTTNPAPAVPKWPPLAGHLKLHIELSNEVWNSGFKAYTIIGEKAAADPQFLDSEKRYLWYGKRLREITVAFSQRFPLGEGRLRPVLMLQQSQGGIMVSVLEWLQANPSATFDGVTYTASTSGYSWLGNVANWLRDIGDAPYLNPAEPQFAYQARVRANLTGADIARQYSDSVLLNSWITADTPTLEFGSGLPVGAVAMAPEWMRGSTSGRYSYSALSRYWGVNYSNYEAAFFFLDDIRGLPAATQTAVNEAFSFAPAPGTPALTMQQATTGYLNSLRAAAIDRVIWFATGLGPPGSFTLSSRLATLDNGRIRGMDSFVTGATPPVYIWPNLAVGGSLAIDARAHATGYAGAHNADLYRPDKDAGETRYYGVYYLGTSNVTLPVALRGRSPSGATTAAQTVYLSTSSQQTDTGQSVTVPIVSSGNASNLALSGSTNLTFKPGLNTLRLRVTAKDLVIDQILINSATAAPRIEVTSRDFTLAVGGTGQVTTYVTDQLTSATATSLQLATSSDNHALLPPSAITWTQAKDGNNQPITGRYLLTLSPLAGQVGVANVKLAAAQTTGAKLTRVVNIKVNVPDLDATSGLWRFPIAASGATDAISTDKSTDETTIRTWRGGNKIADRNFSWSGGTFDGSFWQSPPRVTGDDNPVIDANGLLTDAKHYVWVDVGALREVERIRIHRGALPPKEVILSRSINNEDINPEAAGTTYTGFTGVNEKQRLSVFPSPTSVYTISQTAEYTDINISPPERARHIGIHIKSAWQSTGVSIREVEVFGKPTASLLSNSGFESALGTGNWTVLAGASGSFKLVTTPVAYGSQALRIDQASAGNLNQLRQPVSLIPKQGYALIARGFLENVGSGPVRAGLRVRVEYQDPTNGNAWKALGTVSFDTRNKWVEKSASFTPPERPKVNNQADLTPYVGRVVLERDSASSDTPPTGGMAGFLDVIQLLDAVP